MLGHSSLSQEPISSIPAFTAAAAASNFLWPRFVQAAPQQDLRAMAGGAVMFFGALFGAHSNTAQGSQSTYGTHELAVKQAAQVSSVWSSVRTPPAVANTALPQFIYSRPVDQASATPLIWSPQPAAQSTAVRTIASRPQDNPSQLASQVWPSVASPVTTFTVPLKLIVVLPQDQINPASQVWKSADTAVVLSAARLLPMVQTAPQSDPTQIASRIFAPSVTPPIIVGPTITLFVLNGQPDLNINYSVLWTPSTFSESAPNVPDIPLGPIGPTHPQGYFPMSKHIGYDKPKKKPKKPKVEPVEPEQVVKIESKETVYEAPKFDTKGLQEDIVAVKEAVKALNDADQEAIEALFVLVMME